MKKIKEPAYTWVFAILVTTFFLALFCILTTPLLNSGDDTYFMYMLGGGYGEAPTNLLQYKNGWHPVLGWLVSGLFRLDGGMNWYTIFLLLFHLAGSACVLYVLLKRMNLKAAASFFIALFVFMEARLLLSFTYTGAAFVAATGALCLLIHQLETGKSISRNTVFAVILLLLAGLLRLQVAWLVMILFLPVAITLLKKPQLARVGSVLAVVLILLWGLNEVQKKYYIRNNHAWQKQEQYRQHLFYAYNKQLTDSIPPGTFADSIEQSLFYAGFLYDTGKFNIEKIKLISSQITRNRSLANGQDVKGLYWFFVELRVYLLLLVAAIALLLFERKRLEVKRWVLSFLLYVAVHSYLFIFLKVTIPLHMGLLMYLWISLAMQVKGTSAVLQNRTRSMAAAGVFVLLLAWMFVRLFDENKANVERKEKFACAMNELKLHPDKLFVATDDYFPISYFPVWRTPSQYPAANLLNKDRLITFTYTKALQRYNIPSLDSAVVYDSRVFLLGTALPALEKGKYPAKLSPALPGFGCLQVRRLNATQ